MPFEITVRTFLTTFSNFCRHPPLLKDIPEKIPGRGRRQAIYFSMGGWCRKFSNYMGHWCLTKSNYMGGWYFPAWNGKKEYYLPKKGRSFIKSSQKKAQSLANRSGNGHFCYMQSSKLGCFRRILVKNSTQINSPIVASVAVITSLGKPVFSEEFIQVVRLLVKANTCKNLYQ